MDDGPDRSGEILDQMRKRRLMMTSTVTAATRIFTHRTRSAVFFSIRCSASGEFVGGEYVCGPPNGEGALMPVRSRRVPKELRVLTGARLRQGGSRTGRASPVSRPRLQSPPRAAESEDGPCPRRLSPGGGLSYGPPRGGPGASAPRRSHGSAGIRTRPSRLDWRSCRAIPRTTSSVLSQPGASCGRSRLECLSPGPPRVAA